MRALAPAALLLALSAPVPLTAAPPAEPPPPRATPPAVPADPVDPLEKELSALGKRLEALSAELDRAGDMASAPVATSITLEISGTKGVPAPTGYRLQVDGRVEEERDFGRVERELHSREEGGAPLVVRIPLLPGKHALRLDLSGPGWKAAPSTELSLTLAKGDTPLVRLRLSPPAGKEGDPVLRREK